MRNDDLSQSGNHHPTANDDYDVIPAGSGASASGNTITGRGTVSGAAGADDAGSGGHVTSITGAAGGSGDAMEAAGRYGSIKIDAQGNYTYTRNHGSPDNVEDSFTYTLADLAGALASARLVIRIDGTEEAKVQDNAQRVVAGNQVITLPAGVELSDIHVVGRDLVINLPDGTQMVITDGAVFVPQLALGDVEIPSDTLASLLIDSEPRPAAGPPQSSGGNFGEPVAPLDPGVPLGDLLPPTEMEYRPPTFEELDNPVREEDDTPVIFVQPDGQPATIAAIDDVDEAGLPARAGEPAGSNSASNSEVAGGNIVFTSPDGVTSVTITINGTAYVVVGAGSVTDIPGDYGTLHINGVNLAAGTISYTYTLSDNVNHATDATPWEDFTVTLVDGDGDPATATLRINIADDVPHANADADSVVEDGALIADGNVFTGAGGSDANATDGVADVQGADGAHVTGVAFGNTAGTLGVALQGTFGELVLNSSGAYVYTLHNDAANVQALTAGETRTEVFTYTITDGDGDTSTTTLTITITGSNDRPILVSGATAVSEEGFLAPNSAGNPDDLGNPTDTASSASSSGTLSITDGDGDALTVTLSAPAGSFTSHGEAISWALSDAGHTLTGSTSAGAVIVVTIDNAGHYTVDLLEQFDHPVAGTSPANGEDVLSFIVPVNANDGSVTVDGTLTVSVEDDSPVITGKVVVGGNVDLDESNSGTPVLSPAGAITVTSSGAVIAASVAYGGDGQGAAPAYSLTINSASSGLWTADGDHPITLVQVDATHIAGVFNDGADKVAFSITINGDGSLTVTQNYALEHGDDGSTAIAYNDTNSPLTLAGLVTAHVVYEDYDHDTVEASADIGQLIRFFDDGPSAQVTVQLPDGQALDSLALITGDDGTEGPGSTSDSTTGNFGDAFTLAADGGADGLASSGLSFDLHLIGSGPVDSGLTSHGQIVYLFQVDANTIVAATSLVAVGAGDPSAVFSLSTSDAGAVTLTQYQQIDHAPETPSGSPFADQFAVLGNGIVELVGTGTAVDNDGDTAIDSQSLDLGGLVRFADDGPAIDAALNQGASLHIDESVPGTDGVGETDGVGLGRVTVALASLLTVTDVQVSADSPTNYGYALLLGPASGGLVASGLMTAAGELPIYLYDLGGVIVGSTATDGTVLIANTVFSVALSGTDVVMTQYQAIEHANTSSNDENSAPLAGGALILQVTATDFDGDTSTDTVDLGSTITFGDDGPAAHADVNAVGEGLSLDVDAAAGVLSNDLFGSDGPASGGGVVGVRVAGGDTTSAVTTGIATTIHGTYGDLVLQADGSYSYHALANTNPPAGASDDFVYTIKDGDGDLATTTLKITVNDVSLGTTNAGADVNEAGLATGSNAASTSEIDSNGVIGASGGTGPYTFALTSPAAGSYGTLVLNTATGAYTYTLTSPYDTSPDNNNGTQVESGKDSFTYTVTDANGNTTTGTILVNITDDVPTAYANTNAVGEGASVGGNVLTDGTDDVFGADGPASGGGVVGVRVAGGDTTSAVTTGIATTIHGTYGDLVLQADGSYSYHALANTNPPAGASDDFVYTIKDGDGDLATTTLKITVNDVSLGTTNAGADVNEAGLATGSNAASTSEIDSNGVIGASGGTGPYTFALTSPAAGSYGTLVLNTATGAYTYTLTSPYDTSPDNNNGTQVESGKDSFTYTVTDANGNTTTGTILVNITDDVPTAYANTNAVGEGASVGGNVLTDGTDDVFGADGPASGGGVVGVRVAGGDTTSAVTTGIATTIHGTYGDLVLQADGSYSYHALANTNPPAGASDDFVYTIKDGDGDLATTTLKITVNDVSLGTTNAGADVNEAGLATGSNAASTSEIDSNGVIGASGGTGPYTFALTSPAAGSYGTLVLNTATGAYTYTLTSPYDTSPDNNNGTQVESGKDSFTYTVTDANGNTTTGTILVNITDDVPTAYANTNAVGEGASVGGNVLTDGTDDVFGADGPASGGGVVGVRVAGGDTTSAVTTGIATTIHGTYGDLVLQADGSYSYHALANTNPPAGASDDFVYTIKDGDGDLATTTLKITVNDVSLGTTNAGADVNEAGLATGSNAASTSEIDSNGVIGASGGTGPYTFALTSPAAGSYGTLVLNTATGAYTYTLTSPYDTSPDNNNGTQVESGKDSFTYTVTDANGNTTTGTILVNITDDVPTAYANTNAVGEGASVGGNVLTDGTDDVFGADGPASGGGVVGVRVAGGDTTSAVTTGIATTIHGTYGDLVLQADGSYSYHALANTNPPAGASDDFVYTIKDGDGDLATTTLKITVNDVSLVADNQDKAVLEAALDLVQDDRSGTLNDDLAPANTTGSLPASPAETVSGQLGVVGTGVTYTLLGGGMNGAGGYGLIHLNADGSYTYTLTKAVDGDSLTPSQGGNNGSNVYNNIESFTYVATDANGNTVQGTITIDVTDDVPSAAHVEALVMSNTAGSGSAELDKISLGGDGNIDNNYGADGGKTYFTAASITALQGQNLTSGFSALNYALSADGTVLTATKVSNGSTVFTLTLDPATNDDHYVLNLSQPLDSVQNIDFNDGGYNFVGGNGAWAGFNTLANDNSRDVLLTPIGGGTVNTNANEGGVAGGNSVGSGESMRVDFVVDLTGSPVSGGNFYGGDDNQAFEGHYTVNGASALFTKITGDTKVSIKTYDDADTGTLKNVGDGAHDTLNAVGISYNGESKIVTAAGNVTVGGHVFTVAFSGGDATVDHVVEGTRVSGFTATGFNSIEFGYVSGATFKIGDFGAAVISNQPVHFTVPVSIIDNDGDQVANAGTIDVTLNAPVSPPVVLDTNHDGQVGFLGMDAGVLYDMSGDGHLDHTAWAASGDSILFFDADHNGTVSGASEFVFGSGAMTDLEALHAMYGAQLDGNDADFTMFGLWNDANSNGVVDAGEVQTLAEAGITSIALVSDGVASTEAGGDVQVHGSGAFTYVNDNGENSVGKLADASFTFSGMTAEDEQRLASTSTNAGLLAMAAAAAGLADQTALALPLSGDSDATSVDPQVNVTPSLAPETIADDGLQTVSPLVADNDDRSVEVTPGAHHNAVVAEESDIVVDPAVHGDAAPQALPQGTASAVDSTPLVDVAPLTVMAQAAANDGVDVGSGKQNAIAAADVIQQPDTAIDQLLAKVGGHAGIESLAQVQTGGKVVLGWDTAGIGHLPAAVTEHMGAEAFLLHPDAVQPAMHG